MRFESPQTSPLQNQVLWSIVFIGGIYFLLHLDRLGSALDELSLLRSLTALVAALLLSSPQQTTEPQPITSLLPIALFLTLGLILLASYVWPFAWSIALPALAILLTWPELPNPPLMTILAFAPPYESYLGPHLDPLLQQMTTLCAGPLASLSGIIIHTDLSIPTLRTMAVEVHVTQLCAGIQSYLNLLTLAAVIANLALKTRRSQIGFIILIPIFGFIANTTRVGLSTIAAHHWIDNPQLWSIAHEVIGYATFAGVIAIMLLVTRAARRTTTPQPIKTP